MNDGRRLRRVWAIVASLALVACGSAAVWYRYGRDVRPTWTAAQPIAAPVLPSPTGTKRANGTESCVSAKLEPTCGGAWLGIWPRTDSSGNVSSNIETNTTSLEGKLGRKFDFVLRYYGWGQHAPDATDLALRNSGHMLLMDVRARSFTGGGQVTWPQISSGSQDAVIDKLAANLKSYKKKLFFSFNQEPEQDIDHGNDFIGGPADYAAAYRHVHDRLIADGVKNAVFVWWIMGCHCHDSYYAALYPGDAYVDWISYDPYDFNSCHQSGLETASQSIMPFYNWLNASKIGASKPLMLSEFGANGTSRGSWYAGMAAAIKAAPRIKAAAEFDSIDGIGCDSRVTNSADNWRGFSSMAHDPYFNPAF